MKSFKQIMALLLCIAMVVCMLASCESGPQGEQGIRGEKGDPGETGAQGEKGDKGDPGETIQKVEFDAQGRLVITLTDGTVLPAVEMPKPAGTEGLEYYPLPDGTFGVSVGTTKYLEVIEIPATYNGKAVTKILDNAFSNAQNLKMITIPDSVTSIGNYVFDGCTSLTSVTIPDSVMSIGNSAFSGCTRLTLIFITDLEAWCNISFYNSASNPMCNGARLYLNNWLVTRIEIPDSVTTIKDYVFRGCTSLTSVTIPDSVTSIGNDAFYGCTSLTSVTIPDSVTSIGHSVFYGCTSLESITLPFVGATKDGTDHTYFGCIFGIDVNYDVPASLKEVVITGGTSIGDYAFSNCDSLETITIPDSVTYIGEDAFYDCTSLTTVYYGGSASEWSKITIDSSNSDLTSATRYYYSETEPTESGNYWHYVDGVPTKW